MSNYSFDVTTASTNNEKRNIQSVIGIDTVTGANVDYAALKSKSDVFINGKLKSIGVPDNKLNLERARLGIFLNKSATASGGIASLTIGIKRYNISELTTLFELTRQTISADKTVLTVARLRRILAPEACSLLRWLMTQGGIKADAARKFVTIPGVAVEYSFPEAYIVVPSDSFGDWYKALEAWENTWDRKETEKGKISWLFKAHNFHVTGKRLPIPENVSYNLS